jgi:protein-S-isoprenylcysteine O-methyltransferase Ste14
VTSLAARVIVLAAAAVIGLIRAGHGRRRPRAPATDRAGRLRDAVALACGVAGFVVPILWAVSGWPAGADLAPRSWARTAVGGLVVAGALWMFHRAHANLGPHWSSRLELRAGHQLVTAGLYRRIRHPMYLSLMLYGLGQAVAVPNWIAAWACLAGTGVLYALRVGPEEAMMRARFGEEYDAYVARTRRLVPSRLKQP